MKLSSLLSVRNALRLSGVVALVYGTPMALVPGPTSVLFLGKRKAATEVEKAVINVIVRALGIALVSTGTKSVTAPVSKELLANDVGLCGMYTLYHWLNRFTGKWKDAEGVMEANLLMGLIATTMTLITSAALHMGDVPSDSGKDTTAEQPVGPPAT